MVKKCSIRKINKSLECYHKDNTRKDRKRSSCKICTNKVANTNYTRNKNYRLSNLIKVRERLKNYRKNNPGKIRACLAKRRAQKLKATPSWADLRAIEKFYVDCPKGYRVDYIIPLQGRDVNGLHVLSNLQYLLARENLSKGNRYDSK